MGIALEVIFCIQIPSLVRLTFRTLINSCKAGNMTFLPVQQQTHCVYSAKDRAKRKSHIDSGWYIN